MVLEEILHDEIYSFFERGCSARPSVSCYLIYIVSTMEEARVIVALKIASDREYNVMKKISCKLLSHGVQVV